MEPVASTTRTITIIRKPTKTEPPPIATTTAEAETKRGYLCISRTTKEPTNSIFIGDVEVVVLEVRGNHVKLGIAAPKSTRIDRKERRTGQSK